MKNLIKNKFTKIFILITLVISISILIYIYISNSKRKEEEFISNQATEEIKEGVPSQLGEVIKAKFPKLEIDEISYEEIEEEVKDWKEYKTEYSEEPFNSRFEFRYPEDWEITIFVGGDDQILYFIENEGYEIFVAEFIGDNSDYSGKGETIESLISRNKRIEARETDMWWSEFRGLTPENAEGPFGKGVDESVGFYRKITIEELPESLTELIPGFSRFYIAKNGHLFSISISNSPKLQDKEKAIDDINKILATMKFS